MNDLIPLDWRWQRTLQLGATGLGALVWFTSFALATNPTRPVEIVTPEEVFATERVMPDKVEIRVREDEVQSLDVRTILYREDTRVREQKLDLQFERTAAGGDEDGPGGPVSLATVTAVPESMLQQLEPGIYAHKIEVTAHAKGVPPLEVSAWIRWRTDGDRVELLTLEQYSALVEQAEASIGPDGEGTVVLRGSEIAFEKPGEPQGDRFDIRVGSDGVVPERVVEPKDQDSQRVLDERDEN